MTEPSSGRDPVEALAESFLDRYRRGERPSLTEYADRHPELADQIRALFPALVEVEGLAAPDGDLTGPHDGPPPAAGPAPEQLGDYRIVRELGRGGMGVVYEATRGVLGCNFALKVLGPQYRDDAAYRKRPETRCIDLGKCHIGCADLKRHDEIAERRKRERHDAGENHDRAMHRA